MAKAKVQQNNTEEAQKMVADLRAEIAKLSMDNAKKQLKQTTLLRTKKDALARVLTQMNMNKEVTKKGGKLT